MLFEIHLSLEMICFNRSKQKKRSLVNALFMFSYEIQWSKGFRKELRHNKSPPWPDQIRGNDSDILVGLGLGLGVIEHMTVFA